MRVGPEKTAGPAEAEVRSTASRGIDAASWSVAAIAASAHGGIRRPALCLEEAEVSLFPVRDFSRRLRIPSEFAYLCKIRKVMDNFIVSARKYRPATFASVVGQSHITSTLRNAIARRQLAHAYLFCGPRGVGKTTCARIFAKAINCLDPAADGEACNECESCRAFNEGRSFNIHELDAASNNSVDDIRTLTEQVRIPPQIGRYSVYIIDEVHMLSLQAFNAFLKTLEEPPAHAVFILATTEKHKIIPTILSRCQIYDFNRIRVEDGVGYLKYIASQEGVAYDDESLHIIAQKADGGMRDALSMFDKVVSFCGQRLTAAEVAATLNVLDYDTYFGMTSRILAGDYPAALMMFDEVLRKGFSAQTFAAGLNGHFRDLLMCKNPQTLSLLEVTGSVAERYRSQAAECPVPLLFEGIDLLTAVEQSLRTAVNQRLRVELSLMKLCGLGQKKNDGALSPSLPELSSSRSVPAAPAAPPKPSAEGIVSPPAVSSTSVGEASSGTIPPVSPPPVSAPAEIAARSVAGRGPVSGGAQSLSGQMQGEPVSLSRSESRIASAGSVPPVSAAPSGRQTPEVATPAPAPTNSPVSSPTVSPVSVAGRFSGGTAASASAGPELSVSLSGRSILSLLGSRPDDDSLASDDGPDEPDGDAEDEVEENISPDRIERGCALLTAELAKQRPRLSVVFQDASVVGGKVLLKVPNESLYDEVMNNLTDIRKRLGELSGVRTPVDFEVVIEASREGLKPVKVEDRLRYLLQKNPLIGKLRQALDLDIE